MSVKLTITQIGTPKQYQGAKGPFEKNYLKATEYGNEFLNFFVNKTTSQYKVGDVIEVEAVEKQDYTSKQDGSLKTSYNIKLPKFGNNGDVMKALERIENRQTSNHFALLSGLKELYETITVGKTKEPYPPYNGPTAFDDVNPAPVLEDDVPPLSDEELEAMQ